MRRVLIALAFVAGFALSAGPALAQEGSDGPTDTPSQTTEPTPGETTPAPEETTPPPTDTPTTPAETPGTGDPTPGNEQNSGSNQGGSSGGSSPAAAKLLNSQEDPVDNLGDTVDGKTVKVCQASGSGAFTTGQVNAASVIAGTGVGGGDIVKPFTSGSGDFGGLNWDTGKSIYNNDCTAPTDGSAPGGGATTAPCVTDTVTLLEGETTESPSAAPNPGCEEAAFEILAEVKKVDICHARAAETNPYGPKGENVSVQSIVNPNGHATHTGPVFFEGIQEQWGDIIPPFEHKDGSFPGLNWDAEGQAIFFNDCQIPGDEEPPPPGEEKIPICHARNFGTGGDPYNRPNPSVNGILNGHAGHTGPVFFEGIQEQWGDIIPPFEHENGSFPGLNWDADGQAIYFNDCNVTGTSDDDDDDDDGDDDDGDEEDGDDDDGGGALPDTGGQSLWILLMGGMLTVLGMTILSERGSMRRFGLFGPPLLDVPAMPWSYPADRAADVPVAVVKPESHRSGWTVFGLLMLAAAILGRRGK